MNKVIKMVDTKKLFLTNTSKWEKSATLMFVVLNVLDCISTFFALKLGLKEGNPILRGLFEKNILLGFAAKMLVCSIALLLCKVFDKMKLLKLINIMIAIVVSINFLWVLIILVIYIEAYARILF